MIRSTISAGRRRVTRAPAALLACALLGAFAGLPAGAASAATRIIAGSAVTAGAWPSIARVEANYVVDGTNFVSRCAGTVINPRWVVTAGHCTYDGTTPLAPSALTAMTGRSDLTRSDLGQTIAVDAIVRHPDHDLDLLGSDIALLRLETPTVAAPMRVATPQGSGDYSSPAGVANVAGWGWTQGASGPGSTTLNEAHMSLRTARECLGLLAPYNEYDPATMVCAGGPAGQPTTCNGDSGGPLVQFTDTGDGPQPVLVGITSWGSPGCANGVTAFTRVAAFADFLAPAVDEPVPPPPPPPPPPADGPAAPAALPALAQASSLPGDTSAPRLSELHVPSSIVVRDGRATRAIRVRLRSSEAALVRITLLRSSGGVAQQRRHTAVVARGTHRLTLPRSLWRLRPGSYRLRIEATDAAGNSGVADARLRVRRAR